MDEIRNNSIMSTELCEQIDRNLAEVFQQAATAQIARRRHSATSWIPP